MKAYFVHNNAYDMVVIPDTQQAIVVESDDTLGLFAFPGDDPLDFSLWTGGPSDDHNPEDYGEIVAERDDSTGALDIVDEQLWLERLAFYGCSQSAEGRLGCIPRQVA